VNYIRPSTVEQAAALVARQEGAMLLGGGTVLVPELVRQGPSAGTLVDIGGIDGLRRLEPSNGRLELGAMVALGRIAASAEIGKDCAALSQAAAAIGNPQVRQAATVGGNLALGQPVADLPTALLALGAEVLEFGAEGETSRPVERFLAEGLSPGSLITAVRLPREDGRRSGFAKFAWRRASGKTIVSVAAALRIESGRIAAPRLTAGGLCHRAMRLPEAEELLQGRAWSEELAREAGDRAGRESVCDVAQPPGEDYRRRLVAVGIRRLLVELNPP
jgi:carbon-monoxide dehydrogenase medium subunit